MNNGSFPITGLGVISAAGNNLAETLEIFAAGKRNAGSVTLFETTLQYPVFEVKWLPPEYNQEGRRTLGLALFAVEQALNDAGVTNLSGLRVGVCLGTTVASQLNDLAFYRAYRENQQVSFGAVDRFLQGNLAEFIANKLNAHGPRLTVVNACSSGTDAIGVGLSWLKNDICDLVIAGGADELNYVPYCGFASLSVANSALCAPFDRDRNGLNLGEGAGVIILEKPSCMEQRKKSTELYLAGYGSANDAYHLTAPRPDGAGLRKAIQACMVEASIKVDDIAFINAHGTGTRDNDQVEGTMLAKIFGAEIKMLSTKGFTGHTLGAAGGIEAVFTAAGLRHGWIPASAGFENEDSAIGLSPVRERSAINGRFAISTSLAFGGNNAAIAIERRTSP